MGLDRKDYLRQYQLVWIKKRRDEWLAQNGPCKKCGSTEQLEVDHIDPSTKALNPTYIWSRKKADRDLELAKCQVLCRKCHKQKTVIEFTKIDRVHGTNTTYKAGCRCEECRAAAVAHTREWRYRTGRRIERK